MIELVRSCLTSVKHEFCFFFQFIILYAIYLQIILKLQVSTTYKFEYTKFQLNQN